MVMHSSLWDGWISLSIDQKKDDFSSSTLWSLFLGSWLSRTGSSVVKESQIWARLCLFPAVLLSWLEELAQSIFICLLHQGLWEIEYISHWHNSLGLISALWNIGDHSMGNELLQAASPTVFHHSLDKTYIIAQKQSAISLLSSLPVS